MLSTALKKQDMPCMYLAQLASLNIVVTVMLILMQNERWQNDCKKDLHERQPTATGTPSVLPKAQLTPLEGHS